MGIFILVFLFPKKIMISALNIINPKQTLTILLMVVIIKVKLSLIIVRTNNLDNLFSVLKRNIQLLDTFSQ